jgi:hypothetical protein
MNINEYIANALSIDKINLTKIPNTKNDCYKVTTANGLSVFIKIFKDNVSFENEARILPFLSSRHLKSLSFKVPVIRKVLNLDGLNILISDFISGNSARDILLNSSGGENAVCKRMIVATAEIHSHFLRNQDVLSSQLHNTNLRSISSIQSRLDTLIHQEGKNILSSTEINKIIQLLDSFFYVLTEISGDFPFDYYKDANPANWIFEANTDQLFAVDFEGNRILPFFVDLINIMEYAKSYLSTIEKTELINCYISTREKLVPGWRKSISNYNLQVLYCLFSIYRHHEQLLHRIRDFEKSGFGEHRKFHLDGFHYHLQRFKDNSRLVELLLESTPVEKIKLSKDIAGVFTIYSNAMHRTLNKVS